jgi:hypothetical protein
VHPVVEATLWDTDTVEKWVVELRRVQMVVCVTAAENYRLEVVEQSGTTGPGKYALADIEFTRRELSWGPEATSALGPRPPA